MGRTAGIRMKFPIGSKVRILAQPFSSWPSIGSGRIITFHNFASVWPYRFMEFGKEICYSEAELAPAINEWEEFLELE